MLVKFVQRCTRGDVALEQGQQSALGVAKAPDAA